MHFIGIDWADEKHDICVVNQRGEIITHCIVSDDLAGFRKLADLVVSLGDCQFNIERPNGLLVEWLVGQGYTVYATPPFITAKIRPRRSKSDVYDAYLIADLLRRGSPECRPVAVSSEAIEHLRQIVSAHDHLQRERRRIANQMRYVLKAYYPVALSLFRHVDQPLTLHFLERFPSPQAARQATRDELWAFFTEQQYRYKDRIPLFYERLQAPAPLARGGAGYILHLQSLLALMHPLDQQQRLLAREMKRLLKQHPDANWWLRFPGVGWLNASRLLARLGDNRALFTSAEVLRAVAGTVPVTRRSGKHRSVHFRRACSKPLRKAVMDLAINSVKHSGWARSYYESQLARGHEKPRAYRALANRWVGIIWKLWQSGTFYDERVHVNNRSHQGRQKRTE